MVAGKQIAKGAAWLVMMRIVDRIIGFVSTLVLARLLLPDDFGVVSMAMTVVALLDVLSDFGFEWSIIQRQSKAREDLDTAWSLNVVVGVLNGAMMAALTPFAVRFFQEPKLQGAMIVLALALAISGFRNVGMTLFELDLNYKPVFLLAFARKVAGFLTTITVALLYGSYWALVLGQFVASIAVVCVSYILSPFRPRFRFASFKEIVRFSKWMYATNLLNYVNTRGVQLIIGRSLGAGPLGIYNIAFELGNLATSELVQPTIRALFSGYSRIGDDAEELRRIAVVVFGLAAALALPAAVGVFSLAEPIVQVLLGARWAAVTPLLQVLVVFGAIQALLAPVGIMNLAIGLARLVVGLAFIAAAVGLPVFAVLISMFDLVTGTVALLTVGALVAIANLVVTMRRIGLSLGELFPQVWRPAVGCMVMGGVVTYANNLDVLVANAWLVQLARLVALVVLGAVTYALVVGSLWIAVGRPQSAERHVLSAVAALGRRLRANSTRPSGARVDSGPN